MPVLRGFLVRVMVVGSGLRKGHHQAPVLDTFQANQAAGEFFDPSGFAMDNEYLEARFMIEMRMSG